MKKVKKSLINNTIDDIKKSKKMMNEVIIHRIQNTHATSPSRKK